MERRQHILNATKGLVGELLYYGRKEDEDLSRDEIQAAIAAGEITAGEIVATFERVLRASL